MLLGGRYRLISAPLSTGSFGSVFMADDERIPRRVAVKILHPQHAENPTVRARFKRELDAASRVSHENVVTVFDSGEDKNLGLYYVMELVRGIALKDYLNGEPLPWTFTHRVAVQLTRALHAIHAAGIVHRDLKPQNIMLVERSSMDELVKVLDFGIASLKTQEEEKRDVELTGARMVLGTPPYMSPEQTYMKSDRERLGLEVDARSDVYAMGVIFYEMAAGRRPFSGDAHDIVVAHRLTKPMPLERMVGVAVPREFADLVMRCLAKDPKERPASAKDVLATLKDMELKPIMKWEPDVASGDPQDLATLGEMDALPLDAAVSLPVDTKPRLDAVERRNASSAAALVVVSTASRARAVWAPLAGVAAVALVIVLALTAGRPGRGDAPDDGTIRVAERPALADGADATRAAEVRAATQQAQTASPTVAPPTVASADVVEVKQVGVAVPVPIPETTAAAVADAGSTQHPAPPKDLMYIVTSEPSGAEVLVGGKHQGETPMHLTYEPNEQRQIEIVLRMDKYEDKKIVLPVGPELIGQRIVVNPTLEKKKASGKTDPFKDL